MFLFIVKEHYVLGKHMEFSSSGSGTIEGSEFQQFLKLLLEAGAEMESCDWSMLRIFSQ